MKELVGAPGGGGKEKELELVMAGRCCPRERLDMEPPMLPMDDSEGFCAALLFDQAFEVVAAAQLTELGGF